MLADATSFQTTALAWLTAISAILVAVVGMIVMLAPKVAAAIQAIKDAQDRLNDHSRRISATNDKVTDIALEIPTDPELKQRIVKSNKTK